MARANARTAMSCLGVLVASCFVGPAGSIAANSAAAAATAPLQLRDGRVLHNAAVITDEGDSVVLRADEGLFKLAKTDLPQALSASYPAPKPTPVGEQMVMVPFNPNPPDAIAEPDARPKPKPAPTTAPKPMENSGLLFNGCSIVSFQAKAFQNVAGCAEVGIANGTDAPVVIYPRNFVCVTSSGARRQGRYIVTDGFPPTIKRRDVVPARGTVEEIIIFSNDALDVSSVQWAR